MSPASSSGKSGYQAPQSILETAIYCDDLVSSGRFYEQVVGLSLFSEEANRHRFYRVGEGMLLVFSPATTETSEVRVGGVLIPQHGAHGPGHVAFAISAGELDVVRQRLAAFAIPVESEIDWPGGGHSIYCRDPSNNSVEFATRSLWFGDN